MTRHLKMGLVATGLALGLATMAGAQTINMGAGQQGSRNYATNSAVASLLTENGLTVRLESYGGSGAFLPLINAGDLDLVAVPAADFYDAYTGGEVFGGMVQDNLRVVAALVPAPTGIFVRADSDIDSIEDIAGHKIGYGYTSQPTIRNDIDALLANAGLSIDDMEQVLVPSISANADEFIAGNIDIGFFSLQAGKILEVDAAVDGIRFIDLNADDEALERQKAKSPVSYVMTVPAAEGQVGIEDSLDTYTWDYVLATRADLDDDVVARIVNIVHDNPGFFAEQRSFDNFDPATMPRPIADIPYHPGAIAAYEALGLK